MKENVAKEKKLAIFFAFSLKDVLKDGYFYLYFYFLLYIRTLPR